MSRGKLKIKPAFVGLMLLLMLASGASVADIHLNIVGRAETGKLMDQEVEIKIKMDTGAKTAALSAHDIKIFDKEDEKWVSFIIDSTHFKAEHRFSYPLKRMVRIKKRQEDIQKTGQTFENRPVIEMDLCLNNEIERIEVSLNDRSNFLYPMLLGRTAMEQFAILIDPSAIYTTTPQCKQTRASETAEIAETEAL